MTISKDMYGIPIALGDTVFYDGHYTVKQYEGGEYYLESHHRHKSVTPFNENIMLTEIVAKEIYITAKERFNDKFHS